MRLATLLLLKPQSEQNDHNGSSTRDAAFGYLCRNASFRFGTGKPDTTCPVCAHPMPAGARKCTECDEWQTFRRFVPASQTGLALVLALISIISIVGPPFVRWMWPDSETHVYIVSGELKSLQAAISNTGRRPAILRSYRVSFDLPDFPSETEMGVVAGKSVLMPDEHDIVTLNLKQFAIPKSREADVKKWINTGHVTLRALIKESNDVRPQDVTSRQDVIEASHLGDWIESHIDWTE
jgi:predicted nucleic acid-binding Zn ribbon protein